MAKYLSRINDSTGKIKGGDKPSKAGKEITIPRTSSFIVSQRKILRSLMLMMADGDAVQYKELFKFAVSDFLTKADQFTLKMQAQIRHNEKKRMNNLQNKFRK